MQTLIDFMSKAENQSIDWQYSWIDFAKNWSMAWNNNNLFCLDKKHCALDSCYLVGEIKPVMP